MLRALVDAMIKDGNRSLLRNIHGVNSEERRGEERRARTRRMNSARDQVPTGRWAAPLTVLDPPNKEGPRPPPGTPLGTGPGITSPPLYSVGYQYFSLVLRWAIV